MKRKKDAKMFRWCIHKVAHECKVWAYNKHSLILSSELLFIKGKENCFVFVKDEKKGHDEIYRIFPYGHPDIGEAEGILWATQRIYVSKK